ncbi:MAG TPA: hypothetical protein VLX92_00185 [Kofleriaceae bacterium]|nr:hypothetical protein [Kofleriaceae bacterium]
MSYRWGSVLVLLVGCAQAHPAFFGERPDGGQHVLDGNGDQDGPNRMRDGGGGSDSGSGSSGPMTLSETTDQTDNGSAIACGNNEFGYTSRNSYYRVFPLAEFGITGDFNVTEVDFLDSTSTGSPSLKVSVGTYSGTPGGDTLTTSMISLTTNKTLTPADTDSTASEKVQITADIPAGSNLIVEVDQTTKGTASNGVEYYMGANADGEGAPNGNTANPAPGYISSPDCSGAGTPTSMSEQAGAETDLVLTVTGTAQ